MGIKIFSPLSYSEGKLYGLSPSTPSASSLDLTFARNSSNRTRVNNQGIIQEVPYNLLPYSEEFDSAAWTKTAMTISPNAVQPPNNPNYTADLVYPTGATAFVQASGTTGTAGGTTHFFSVYAKAAGKNFIMLNPTGGTTGVWFNLSTGAVGTQSAGAGVILNMGNGWYHCIWRGTVSGALQPIIRISDADNSTSNTASGTNGVFLWGAQLSRGNAVQPYLKTTNRLNVPAIDYSLSTGGSGCLLMEPQRTNILTYSEDFNDVVWTKSNSSVNSNTILSPNGDNFADFLIENTSNTSHGLERANLTILNNTIYTGSLYLKSTDRNIRIVLLLRPSGNAFIDVDLTNGNVISSGGVLSYSVNKVGNNWYKISLTNSSTTTTGGGMNIYLLSGTTATYVGNGTSGVSLWGAQIEQGSYQTTYIPTVSTAQTRTADSFSRNALFSNNYVTAAGGTWFVDLDNNIALTRDAADVGLFLGDTATGTTNSFCINTPSGSSRMEIDSYVNGSATTLHVTTTDRTRAAIKWNGSTADVFVNGSKVVSGTTFTGTTLEYMGLNVRDTPKYIRGMWLAPVPLTDADLAMVTTRPLTVDSDAQAFISAAAITDSTQQLAIDTLVKDLKSFGIWSKMKAIYPFVGGTAASHKFNLKDPRDVDGAFRLVFNGGWTHSATGALPNGTTGYANTFLTPSNTLLDLNSTHLSYYSKTNNTEQRYQIGVVMPTTWLGISIKYSGNTYSAVNALTENLFADSSSLGYYLASRINTNSQKIWKNGVVRVTGNVNSTSLATIPIFIGGVNNPNSNYQLSAKECAFATIGDGLTDTEAANLYTAVQKYQTTLGRQV